MKPSSAIVKPEMTAVVTGELPLETARRAEDYLREHDVLDPRLEAELILASVLGVSRLRMYLDEDVPLDATQLLRYRQMIERRAKREPLQYVVGSTQFREIDLRCDPRALIPRPETEVLVGLALDWARARTGVALRALDIGTGTGAIALSLLAEKGAERVVATDVSRDALALAAENAQALGVSDRIELRAGALYEPIASDERFDMIVSNPPYIATAERGTLATEVVDWEPEAALFAGARGMDVIEPLVRGARARLERCGLLALELAPGQAEEVAELARASGFRRVRIVNDLAGRARIVAAEID